MYVMLLLQGLYFFLTHYGVMVTSAVCRHFENRKNDDHVGEYLCESMFLGRVILLRVVIQYLFIYTSGLSERKDRGCGK